MREPTWVRLDKYFTESPSLRAESVPVAEVNEAERSLAVTLPPDYREFIARFGGAILGSLPIYGLRRAEPMGRSEGSFVEVTRRFRKQGWPGVDGWVVISTDGSGNPIGLDAAGAVWISDHDAGSIERLADDFEEFITGWCLAPRSRG